MEFFKKTLEVWAIGVSVVVLFISLYYTKVSSSFVSKSFLLLIKRKKRIFIKIEPLSYKRRRIIAKCP